MALAMDGLPSICVIASSYSRRIYVNDSGVLIYSRGAQSETRLGPLGGDRFRMPSVCPDLHGCTNISAAPLAAHPVALAAGLLVLGGFGGLGEFYTQLLLCAGCLWFVAALIYGGIAEFAGETAGGGNAASEAVQRLDILRTDPDATYGDMIRVFDELRQAPDKIDMEIKTISIPTQREISNIWAMLGILPGRIARPLNVFLAIGYLRLSCFGMSWFAPRR